jgi:hypothetical protein
VVIPSENIVVDREVTWTATPTFRLTIAAGTVANNQLAMSYGHTEALNQFPLDSLLTNATVTINTASVSVNTQDIMHCLLRTTDDEKWSKYKCPHMSDKRFKNYSDMALSESNPLGSFGNAKGRIIPRGSHPIKIRVERFVNGASANVETEASDAEDLRLALTCSAMATKSWVIDISYEFTERLHLFTEKDYMG